MIYLKPLKKEREIKKRKKRKPLDLSFIVVIVVFGIPFNMAWNTIRTEHWIINFNNEILFTLEKILTVIKIDIQMNNKAKWMDNLLQ